MDTYQCLTQCHVEWQVDKLVNDECKIIRKLRVAASLQVHTVRGPSKSIVVTLG